MLAQSPAHSERINVFPAFEPAANIVYPVPSHLVWAFVGPDETIGWKTQVEAGRKVVRFKYRLIRDDDPAMSVFVADPDSLRRRDAPAYAGWDSVGGDVDRVSFTGLETDRKYLFAIVAFDDSGASTPWFSLDRNLLWMLVVRPQLCGPWVRVWSPFFDTREPGGFADWPPLFRSTVPAGRRFDVHWQSVPHPFQPILGYRWTLLPNNPSQWRAERWSRWSLADTVMTLHALSAGDSTSYYTLMVQAKDHAGCLGTQIIVLHVIRPNRP